MRIYIDIKIQHGLQDRDALIQSNAVFIRNSDCGIKGVEMLFFETSDPWCRYTCGSLLMSKPDHVTCDSDLKASLLN